MCPCSSGGFFLRFFFYFFFASGSLFDLLVGSLCGCLSGSGYSSACLSCSPFLCGCDFPTGIFGWGLFSHVIVLAFAMAWDFSLLSSMAVRISSLGILEAGFLVFGFVVTSLVLISFISHLQSRLVPLLPFARLGRHQAVQLCISWKRIFKRHQIPEQRIRPWPAPTLVM